MAAQGGRAPSLWEGVRARLQKAMKARGVGVTELGRRLDVRQGTVSAWFDKKKKPAEPKAEQLAGIPRVLRISGHWLLTGEGAMDDAPGEAERLLGEIRRLLDTSQPIAPSASVPAEGTMTPAEAEEAFRRAQAQSTPPRGRKAGG